MALFFDRPWFEARMAERGLTAAVLAAAAGLSEADLALVFKDQREVSAREVEVFAELLGESPAEVARQAGVSTPVPGQDPLARIAALERRVATLEAEIVRLRSGAASSA
ncbi:helix-turn-helix domain-containing protein [Phenylobacterium aquaticum]|uniref:helix-turn-helix domain-containing protein n=1 Tax=Phenylobacterium aquaticum TaxID=1763816 RepID=UPI001F5DF765|nr:helix-turn-helix domain-containing protein [Phenylobacterium aquaticum]